MHSCSAGHAGSRIGWALVADPAVAERMRRFILLQSMWSYENQLRGALVLEHVLATKGTATLCLTCTPTLSNFPCYIKRCSQQRWGCAVLDCRSEHGSVPCPTCWQLCCTQAH